MWKEDLHVPYCLQKWEICPNSWEVDSNTGLYVQHAPLSCISPLILYSLVHIEDGSLQTGVLYGSSSLRAAFFTVLEDSQQIFVSS